MKFQDIEIKQAKCILIPGGDPYDMFEDESIQPLVKRILENALDNGVIIGAICAAPAILGKCGTLLNKRFTHGYGDFHKEFLEPLWQGAIFTDEPVTIDGTIVTAKASAHIDFGVEIAALAGAINPNQRDTLKNFYNC